LTQTRHGERGLSLFRPIPSKRTCSALGIPWEYCVCVKETNVSSLSDYRVKSSAHALVNHINGIVKKLDKKKLCTTPLLLNSTFSAQILDPPDNEQSREELKANPAVYLRVAVVVSPSGAELEGIVKRSLYTVKSEVLGEVNRINEYDQQSECVKDSKLRLYCYCKTYAENEESRAEESEEAESDEAENEESESEEAESDEAENEESESDEAENEESENEESESEEAEIEEAESEEAENEEAESEETENEEAESDEAQKVG
jgi:flagellar biosynthesis GTPase FlhF